MATRRFQFRLQKVLDYRVIVERRVQSELAELEHARLQAEEDRRELERRLREAHVRHSEISSGEIDLVEENLQRLFIRELDRLIVDKDAQLRALRVRISAKRAELLRASRDRKVMERLREKAHAEYVAEALRAEQKFLDELGDRLDTQQVLAGSTEGLAREEAAT